MSAMKTFRVFHALKYAWKFLGTVEAEKLEDDDGGVPGAFSLARMKYHIEPTDLRIFESQPL